MLNFQENLLPERVVKEEPTYRERCHLGYKWFPSAQVVDEPVSEDISDRKKVEQTVIEVDGIGV